MHVQVMSCVQRAYFGKFHKQQYGKEKEKKKLDSKIHSLYGGMFQF